MVASETPEKLRGEIGGSARRYYNFEEWELPGGAQAQLIWGKATILLPRDTAFQAMVMFGRSVWTKEVSNHINPGAPEVGKVRLYQFVANLSFDSMQFEGYRATISLRVTTWPEGDRRRERSEPKLPACLGDPLGVINAGTPRHDRLSARGLWPATEEK